MKSDLLKKFLLIAVVCSASVSCAKYEANEDNLFYEKALLSWVKVNFPNAVSTVSDLGVYTLESVEGTGLPPVDSQYVLVHYTKRDLEGMLLDTNEKDVAESERPRTFDKVAFYGPSTWILGSPSVPAGINETLRKMRVGGKVTVAVPLAASSVETSVYSTFVTAETDNVIYSLTLEDVVSDINQYQLDSMYRFRNHNFPELDTMVTGFFFKKFIEVDRDTDNSGTLDSITDGATLKTRYIARLLDGHVFDTNIADTAKKYGFYKESNSYSALEVTYHDDIQEMIKNAGTVEGFARAVHELYYGEYGATFFWSDMGYGETGSGDAVPEYSPLFFQIWVEEQE